jgi:hypothetical protein
MTTKESNGGFGVSAGESTFKRTEGAARRKK